MKKFYRKPHKVKDETKPLITHQKSKSKWAFLIVDENGRVQQACYYYDSAYDLRTACYPTAHIERIEHGDYRQLIFNANAKGKDALIAKTHKKAYEYMREYNAKGRHAYYVNLLGREDTKILIHNRGL